MESARPVSELTARSVSNDVGSGAQVASVKQGSPADKAGLKSGDILTRYNNKPVGEFRRFPRLVAEGRIGSQVPLTVWRELRRIQLPVRF